MGRTCATRKTKQGVTPRDLCEFSLEHGSDRPISGESQRDCFDSGVCRLNDIGPEMMIPGPMDEISKTPDLGPGRSLSQA